MDSVSNVDRIIEDGDKALNEGHYREAISIFTSLLKRKKALSPLQEFIASQRICVCHRMLNEFKAALPYVRRCLAMSPEVHGHGSRDYANTVRELGMVELGLWDCISAKNHFNQVIVMLKALGLENSVDYGCAHRDVADVDKAENRYEEAFDGYVKAEAVMNNFKDDHEFGVLLNNMGLCLKSLKRYAEAVVYLRQVVEWSRKRLGNQHPNCAISLNNLGTLFMEIKQYELAIHQFEEALSIAKVSFGDKHAVTIRIAQFIAESRVLQKKDRLSINTDHDYRMCNACLKVDTTVANICACDKVYYCSDECCEKFWLEHKPDCVKCFGCDEEFPNLENWKRCSVCNLNKYCSTACQEKDKGHKCVPRCYKCHKDGVKLMKCSVCNVARYCSADCQKAHWGVHKMECKKK
jgi:tetratricopeptide (TPR) repeat protein